MEPEEQPETVIINQIGLILTQLRFARRAMEDIERNTARYGGISFATALASGARFGEPPLHNGALKVHIVNLSDLNPGSGFGGLIEGILGGVGRFFGSFFGGLVGGTLSGIALPMLLVQVDRIVSALDRMMARMATLDPPKPKPEEEETPTTSMDLNHLSRTVEGLTALFTAATKGGDEAAKKSDLPATEMGREWLVMLYTASVLVESIGHVIDGLVIFVPILTGALASLVMRFDDIKVKIIDMLQFALRNVFLLRGTTLLTVYDTVAGAARLGANILEVIGTTMGNIMGSIMNILESLLNAAAGVIKFIGGGLKSTMDGLLDWLEKGLGNFLINVGKTNIFLMLRHLVEILPGIVGPLVLLVRGMDILDSDRRRLDAAAALGAIPPSGLPSVVPPPVTTPGGLTKPPGGPAVAPFPDLGKLLAPPERVAELQNVLRESRSMLLEETSSIFGEAQGAFTKVQNQMNDAQNQAVNLFGGVNAQRLEQLEKGAAKLAEALQSAKQAAEKGPETGLEAIANAYESWISGGGLSTVLSQITTHFQQTPTDGPGSDRTVLARIVATQSGIAEPPAATVEIGRLEIEVTPPTAEGISATTTTVLAEDDGHLSPSLIERIYHGLKEFSHELVQRGGQP